MTLKHMKIYLEVYKYKNITKAADSLYMTQPAVSRAIQEIERYYGVRLFERINHRLYVTEVGKMFYSYALHISDSVDQMEKGLRNWDEFGVLRIGTSVSIGTFQLPGVMTAFRKKHPDLKIRATISNAGTLQQSLLDNELDFAVMEGGVSSELLVTETISQDRLVPVLPPDSPQKDTSMTLQELARFPLLLREKDSAGRSFLDHVFALHHICADPILESISTQAILQGVHAGLGISFLPEQLIRRSIQSGLVATCLVSDEPFLRDNCLVWHKQKFLTRSAQDAMALFRKHSRR